MEARTAVLVVSLAINLFLMILGIPGSVICSLEAISANRAAAATDAMHVHGV